MDVAAVPLALQTTLAFLTITKYRAIQDKTQREQELVAAIKGAEDREQEAHEIVTTHNDTMN